MCICSLVVACKYWDDDTYANDYYAEIGGVPNSEMNKLEMKFLCLMEYDLKVDPVEFADYKKQLSTICPKPQTAAKEHSKSADVQPTNRAKTAHSPCKNLIRKKPPMEKPACRRSSCVGETAGLAAA